VPPRPRRLLPPPGSTAPLDGADRRWWSGSRARACGPAAGGFPTGLSGRRPAALRSLRHPPAERLFDAGFPDRGARLESSRRLRAAAGQASAGDRDRTPAGSGRIGQLAGSGSSPDRAARTGRGFLRGWPGVGRQRDNLGSRPPWPSGRSPGVPGSPRESPGDEAGGPGKGHAGPARWTNTTGTTSPQVATRDIEKGTTRGATKGKPQRQRGRKPSRASRRSHAVPPAGSRPPRARPLDRETSGSPGSAGSSGRGSARSSPWHTDCSGLHQGPVVAGRKHPPEGVSASGRGGTPGGATPGPRGRSGGIVERWPA